MKKMFTIVTIFTLSFILSLVINVNRVMAENYPFEGMIIADALGVHNAPNILSNSQISELAFGTKVKVLGVQGSVYKIDYYGSDGYVAKSQVINVDANTSKGDGYNEYCESLKGLGFPESYCPYLFYLHTKHPAWSFRPENTGVSLVEAAEKEKWLSALQTVNPNYYLNGSPLEADYYYVNADVVKMFLDAKNGLFENIIFQFLDLESSKDFINDTAVSSVATGNLANYKNEFIVAANTYAYNVLHLLARSKQEGASNAKYRAVTGTYTTELNDDPTVNTVSTYEGKSLDGYYNFYNIGAYPVPSMNLGAIGRGLAYAAGFIGGTSYGRPWTSPEKAILGGAEFLKEQYVSKGQNTLYYEKFNVGPNNGYSKYSHQYMTNIYAPIQEAKSIYSAYSKAGLLNSGFVFLIPVYTDSGSNGGSTASDRSYNNYLKNIKVNGRDISDFDRETLEYHYNVYTTDTEVELTAEAEENGATVEGVGKLTFVNDRINAVIVVTAPSGTKRSISIELIRKDGEERNLEAPEIKVNDVVNNLGIKMTGDCFYGLSLGTGVGDIINLVNSRGAQVEVKDASGNVKNNGPLSTGDTVIIKGTKESKNFSIGIRGEINGDNKVNIVDLLLVQKHILSKGDLGGNKFLAGDTNYDGKINIVDLLLIQKHILGKGNL